MGLSRKRRRYFSYRNAFLSGKVRDDDDEVGAGAAADEEAEGDAETEAREAADVEKAGGGDGRVGGGAKKRAGADDGRLGCGGRLHLCDGGGAAGGGEAAEEGGAGAGAGARREARLDGGGAAAAAGRRRGGGHGVCRGVELARGGLGVVAGLETVLDGRLVGGRRDVGAALELHLARLVDAVLEDLVLDGPALGGVDSPLDGTAERLVGEVLNVLLGQLDVEHAQVLLDARRRDALCDGDDVTAERPCEEHLGRGDVVALGDVDDDGVLEVLCGVLVGAEGRVGLEGDAVSVRIVAQLVVVHAEVDLDLVDDGLDLGGLGGLADAADVEVGDADVANLALLDHLLHDAVGGHEVARELGVLDGVSASGADGADHGAVCVHEGDGPVHEVEVEVVCAEVLERVVERLFDVFWVVEAVPELGGDPELVTLDAGLLDAVGDGVLIAVGPGAVEVAEAGLERVGDGGRGLFLGHLPCSEAELGDLGAIGEGEGGEGSVTSDGDEEEKGVGKLDDGRIRSLAEDLDGVWEGRKEVSANNDDERRRETDDERRMNRYTGGGSLAAADEVGARGGASGRGGENVLVRKHR
ncbi:hypothetical protein L1887_60501 [Cichorium endivia]|nr:hypothetical protein L1887_60501 [Cichorium endivia]